MASLIKRRRTPIPEDNIAVDEVLPSDLVEDDELDIDIYNPDDYDPDKLLPYEIYEPIDNRDGPEGFIQWCEDNVWVPIYPDGSDIAVWTSLGALDKGIHPKSGKSYNYIWEQ